MTGIEIVLLSLLGTVCAVVLLLQLGLLRRVLPALERAERLLAADPMAPDSGLGVGSTVSAFTAFDAMGKEHRSSDLLAHGPLLVLFAETGCPSCAALVAELRGQGWSSSTRLLLVSDKPEPWGAEMDGNVLVTYQVSATVSEAFRQTALPQAFLVSAEQIVIGRVFPTSVTDLHVTVAAANSPAHLNLVSADRPHTATP